MARQPTTPGDAFQVSNVNAFMGQIGLVKSRYQGRAVSRNQPFGFLPAENYAAHSVNSVNLRAHVVCAHIFSASSKRSTSTGGAEQVINFSLQASRNLA